MNKEFLLFVKWEKDELHIFVRYFVFIETEKKNYKAIFVHCIKYMCKLLCCLSVLKYEIIFCYSYEIHAFQSTMVVIQTY